MTAWHAEKDMGDDESPLSCPKRRIALPGRQFALSIMGEVVTLHGDGQPSLALKGVLATSARQKPELNGSACLEAGSWKLRVPTISLMMRRRPSADLHCNC